MRAACPGYTVDHGTYACEWSDTIAKNPVGFTIKVLLLAASLGFVYFTGFTGRGFQLRLTQTRVLTMAIARKG